MGQIRGCDNIRTMNEEKQQKEALKIRAESFEKALVRLKDLVELLRRDCPWDRKQTHDSLRRAMIEEAYEACEAIQKNDVDNLREELGDVLLQVVFHAVLAEEEKIFDFSDVINGICDKMIARHPHIFEQEDIKSVDTVLEKWENIKQLEQADKSWTQQLNEIPGLFPALIRAFKLQAKAAKAGFDWPDVEGAIEKLDEEKTELLEAVEKADRSNIEEELGDLLFSIVNVARFLDVEPEEALNKSNRKFIKRFEKVENSAKSCGKELEDCTLDELDIFWHNAKDK